MPPHFALSQDEIKKLEEAGIMPAETKDASDLPGGGAHYCMICARHFVDAPTLDDHFKTKQHKRRLKAVSAAPYTQAEADAGAGMGRAD